MAEGQKAKAKGKKIGRSLKKCATYKARQTREKHKLRNILRTNDWEAAQAYAKAKGLKFPANKTKRVKGAK